MRMPNASKRKGIPVATRLPKKQIISHLLVICLLGGICYANSMAGKFIYDDDTLIVTNVYIKNIAYLSAIFTKDVAEGAGKQFGFYRPLQSCSYLVDYALWKLKPFGFHLTNILLHLFAACAVYYFVSVLFATPLLALFTASLFVIHPVHTEAVAYISGRSDPMALIFMLICFAHYIKADKASNFSVRSYAIIAISYVAALLSRENALSLLLLIPLYHYAFRKKIKPLGPAIIIFLSFIYVIVRSSALQNISQEELSHVGLPQRVTFFFAAFADYLRLLVFPVNLHMEYGMRPSGFVVARSLAGLAAFSLILVLAIKKMRPHSALFFSASWFMVALLPVSNIVPLNAYMAEHWLYLPSIGIFLLLSQSILFLLSRMRIAGIAFGIVIVTYWSILTLTQNAYWHDPILFAQRTLQYNPENERILGNLSVAYMKMENFDLALDACQRLIKIRPNSAGNYCNLGILYAKQKRYDEAIEAYDKALSIDPRLTVLYNNIGSAYAATGKLEEAVTALTKALEINPLNKDACYNLSKIYEALGRAEEASRYRNRWEEM